MSSQMEILFVIFYYCKLTERVFTESINRRIIFIRLLSVSENTAPLYIHFVCILQQYYPALLEFKYPICYFELRYVRYYFFELLSLSYEPLNLAINLEQSTCTH